MEGGAVVDIDENTYWAMDVYDNAMFVIALNGMMGFAKTETEKKKWKQLRDTTAANIRSHLWDQQNKKFIPHLYVGASPFPPGFDENKIHFHGGTAIAIEAGLLSKKEIAIVNNAMLQNVRLSGAPSIGLTLYPPYPEDIYKNSTANKPYIYQNGGDWTWFGGRMIQQLISNGFIKKAYVEVQPMIDHVIKNDTIYEWTMLTEKPMGRLILKDRPVYWQKRLKCLSNGLASTNSSKS